MTPHIIRFSFHCSKIMNFFERVSKKQISGMFREKVLNFDAKLANMRYNNYVKQGKSL